MLVEERSRQVHVGFSHLLFKYPYSAIFVPRLSNYSPFSCEVLYIGNTVVRGKSSGLCFGSELTTAQARAIAVEAAMSKTGEFEGVLRLDLLVMMGGRT